MLQKFSREKGKQEKGEQISNQRTKQTFEQTKILSRDDNATER